MSMSIFIAGVPVTFLREVAGNPVWDLNGIRYTSIRLGGNNFSGGQILVEWRMDDNDVFKTLLDNNGTDIVMNDAIPTSLIIFQAIPQMRFVRTGAPALDLWAHTQP